MLFITGCRRALHCCLIAVRGCRAIKTITTRRTRRNFLICLLLTAGYWRSLTVRCSCARLRISLYNFLLPGCLRLLFGEVRFAIGFALLMTDRSVTRWTQT